MDNRTIAVSFDDLFDSEEAVGRMLTAASVGRPTPQMVKGWALEPNRLLFFLEKDDSEWAGCRQYVIDCLSEKSLDLPTLCNQRWQGGFSTLGFFELEGSRYGIFERIEA